MVWSYYSCAHLARCKMDPPTDDGKCMGRLTLPYAILNILDLLIEDHVIDEDNPRAPITLYMARCRWPTLTQGIVEAVSEEHFAINPRGG